MSFHNRICAALDFGSWREAEPFARTIAPHVGLLKVGLEIFTAEGPPAVRAAAAPGSSSSPGKKVHSPTRGTGPFFPMSQPRRSSTPAAASGAWEADKS